MARRSFFRFSIHSLKGFPMSLSNATLSAIQKAGAAVFAADAQLKNATREYADRIKAALESNPLSLENDALFENWKTVARLSRTIAGIEEEITKVFHAASELMADKQPVLVRRSALAKPKRAVNESAGRQTERPMARASAKAKKPMAKRASRTGSLPAISGNAAKLLNHLEQVLNTQDFSALSQTTAAKEIGIPLGSMTAAIKKLMEHARLIAGPAGSFKLATGQAASPQ